MNNHHVVVILCRVPLPELKDSDKLDKIMNMKEATKRIRLSPDSLPSICFYSFLNAYQVRAHHVMGHQWPSSDHKPESLTSYLSGLTSKTGTEVGINAFCKKC